jgi:hypothetical protein
MATNMRINHTTSAIEHFLTDFAGRPEMPGYDENKSITIAEENRDFVWPPEMWVAFIISIFSGFPIPNIVICDNKIMDGGNRSTVLKKWRQNEFTVKFGEWEGNYDAMTPAIAAQWNRCSMPMTIITNATRDERSQIYENYNKGKVLTPGQSLWNRSVRPLVAVALSLIGRGNAQFPFADLIHSVWRRKWKKTPTLGELAFAFQIIVGSMFGPNSFHKMFHLHLNHILTVTAEQIDLSNLRFICETIQSADPQNHVNAKKKEDIFKKFIGSMIYDIHMMPRDTFAQKWRTFCSQAYTDITKEQLKTLIDVGTDRANNQSRIQRLSQKVTTFLAGNVVAAGEPVDYDSDDSDDTSEY